MKSSKTLSRRQFLVASGLALGGVQIQKAAEPSDSVSLEPVIDIHQHTDYSGRNEDRFVAHQRAMGISLTILLPSGRPVNLPSTHGGRSNGLAAQCGGNESVLKLAEKFPTEFRFFANEVVDLPGAVAEVEAYLKKGAKGIGEQKFGVDCDSKAVMAMAELAQEYKVPMLLHFQHDAYNTGIDRFHKVLDKFPEVNFIGHAQTWWGNIDRDHQQPVMYPPGKVVRGGITDRLLSDYPNMYGDLSAGSGLNALLRDEEHTIGFLERHQDKLLYGSDCNDILGRGPSCQGGRTLAALRRLAPTQAIARKLLFENARRLIKLDLPW